MNPIREQEHLTDVRMKISVRSPDSTIIRIRVVVTADSQINTLAGRKRKTFCQRCGWEAQQRESPEIILQQAGLTHPDDIKIENIGFTEAVDMMRNKRLDGAWIMAGLGNSAVTEAASTAKC